jgi:hypothetical protein
LSVEVYVTSYSMSTQWASIKVNGTDIVEHCLPSASCIDDWFPCVVNTDISSYLKPQLGGSLSIEVSVSADVNTGPCNYPGTDYSLYTRMNLRDMVPSSMPSGEPSSYPSRQPSSQPTNDPSSQPTGFPSSPSAQPTSSPSGQPTSRPSCEPTVQPSGHPSSEPTIQPSAQPTALVTQHHPLQYQVVNQHWYLLHHPALTDGVCKLGRMSMNS